MSQALSKRNPWQKIPSYIGTHTLRQFIIGGSTVNFYEIHGYGPPQNDIGYPGDIYVDLTPSPLVYVRRRRRWACWNWSRTNPLKRLFKIVEHPTIKGRYLWGYTGTKQRRFSWYHPATISCRKGIPMRGRHDIGLLANQIISGSGVNSNLSPENFRRREKETRRRREILLQYRCQMDSKEGLTPSHSQRTSAPRPRQPLADITALYCSSHSGIKDEFENSSNNTNTQNDIEAELEDAHRANIILQKEIQRLKENIRRLIDQ